ncbi:MAG TPA: deoxyribodipyrimidine photo-lyase [Candidatus Limnocylindria bacterium]|nr:deoxyribodipyrimidine photo-lyase [Candidatus Limnocylindria bacterium]
MSDPSTAIVWFRRDLRLHDHPALARAVRDYERVVPLFVLDDALLNGRWPSPNRVWYMARSVSVLAESLAERGAPLAILRGRPTEVVPEFARAVGAATIFVSRDYAPYGRRRDSATESGAASHGIAFEAQPGVLVHEPEDVRKADGGHFTVFSPFRRTWQALPRRPVLPAPARIRSVPARPSGSAASIEELLGSVTPTAEPDQFPEPGEQAARRRLAAWSGSAALDDYADGRDRLDRSGTSRLSQDLRWGVVSPVEVLERCAGSGRSRDRFASEIGWRDFYAHLLWHEPRLAREAFRRELEHVAWSADQAALDAWREGRTGYPVVDAAMRQLRTTGWMHNRGRMIAASFLTKHLGVDWRVGEAHFMAHLLDGEMASNNGGWQWAASTGTDPQPYFRIFNPTLQGQRHDPRGDYVRRWLPELDDALGYPQPLVEHAGARRRAIAEYESRTRGGS